MSLNNAVATAYVRSRLAAAGFVPDEVTVVSRDLSLTEGPRAYSVRTEISLSTSRPIPLTTRMQLALVLGDLPGYIDGHTDEGAVVAFWHGPS